MNAAAPVERLGLAVYGFTVELGRAVTFLQHAVASVFKEGIRWRQTMDQMLQIGVRSSFLIVLTGFFTGLVFALESSYAFSLFQAEALIGPSVVLSLTRELGPVLGGLMVTARAGSAIATELGSMRVTEQIDALESMAVSPYAYLVTPRLIATTMMLPLLVVLYNFVGFLGAYGITVYVVGVSGTTFLDQVVANVDLLDIYSGVIKAFVFGFLIAIICTSRGFFAKGGAKGVGLATTQSVVLCSVVILVADYFLTIWIFGHV